MSHVYLRKDNNDLVSHCKCEIAYISFPPQMDCPWCGCGWLFTCIDCRRAFTFARAVEVDQSWHDLAVRDITNKWRQAPEVDEAREWVDAMKQLHEGVQPGRQYVYLDGLFVPTSAESLEFEGWYAEHDLGVVPQVAALEKPAIIDETIGDVDYWRRNALPEESDV